MNDWLEDRMIKKEVTATLRADIAPLKLLLLVSFEIVKIELTMPFNAYIWLLLDTDYAYVSEGFQCEHPTFKAFKAIVFHLPLIEPMWLDNYLDEVAALSVLGTAYNWKTWIFDKLAEWADDKFTEARVEKYPERYLWRGLGDLEEVSKRILNTRWRNSGRLPPTNYPKSLELDGLANSDDNSVDDDNSGADDINAGDDMDGVA
ncbi:hypothetical protein B0T18DRAFT_394082 [Schizothecium vesticola]|uniref:Uncharacterized protein n=1 Tax=Schizothecium vesticola TaxID=314040 RepID=A0AA40K0M7_9PEZI|nr:hypothetical protein B0T18DRAFT_394082 [Schizothecium vesticola]